MASDIVQAVFSSAAPGSDLTAFAPSVGSGFARHPTVANNPIVATAAHRFRAGVANSNILYTNQTTPPGADYSVRVRATMINPTGTDTIGPVIRCSSSVDTFYTFVWIKFTNVASGLALFKHVNGQAAQVGDSVTTLNGASVIPVAGAEAVIDFVGEGDAIDNGLAMTRNAGFYYIVGYGGRINVPTIDMIVSEKTIVGNLVGTYPELVELMALADRGLVTLATKEYALSAANDALHDLHNGKIHGRAVLIP